MEKKHLCFLLHVAVLVVLVLGEDREPLDPEKLQKYSDEIPIMPRIFGYTGTNTPLQNPLTIGMYEIQWQFHKEMKKTTVYAYGTSKQTASVPGPTIIAGRDVNLKILWDNYLPSKHFLPVDETIPIAKPPSGKTGIPTVVHLHGAFTLAASDGHPLAWYTRDFNDTPTFSSRRYTYPNTQHPGNLWYHDNALGLARLNVLAGLMGMYQVYGYLKKNSRLIVPTGEIYDRHLVIFDRDFNKDGSLYVNPEWQSDYKGSVMIVNGMAWPYMRVNRAYYRFRILNGCNSRFLNLYFSDDRLKFRHLGSDSEYLPSLNNKNNRLLTKNILLAPGEIGDVLVNFRHVSSNTHEVILHNDANFPYPNGDSVANKTNGTVMEFKITQTVITKNINIPESLTTFPHPSIKNLQERYITMYKMEKNDESTKNDTENEDTNSTTITYNFNQKTFSDPVTETPKDKTSEIWNIINLTENTEPFHVHLVLFHVLKQTKIKADDLAEFTTCMMGSNDAKACNLDTHLEKELTKVPEHEKGWKNVFKVMPGSVARLHIIFDKFELVKTKADLDLSARPGYVYHSTNLNHQDNEMLRPLMIQHQ